MIGHMHKSLHLETEVYVHKTQSQELMNSIGTILRTHLKVHSLTLPKNKQLCKSSWHSKCRSNVDTYISTFENLVWEAGYNHDAKGTVHLFAQGLHPNLLKTLVYLPAIPVTMDEWQDKACEEIKNNATRETMLQPSRHHYKWQYSNNNGWHYSRCYPNDQTVPMDVDPPVFT
jgi:hypothetical protein